MLRLQRDSSGNIIRPTPEDLDVHRHLLLRLLTSISQIPPDNVNLQTWQLLINNLRDNPSQLVLVYWPERGEELMATKRALPTNKFNISKSPEKLNPSISKLLGSNVTREYVLRVMPQDWVILGSIPRSLVDPLQVVSLSTLAMLMQATTSAQNSKTGDESDLIIAAELKIIKALESLSHPPSGVDDSLWKQILSFLMSRPALVVIKDNKTYVTSTLFNQLFGVKSQRQSLYTTLGIRINEIELNDKSGFTTSSKLSGKQVLMTVQEFAQCIAAYQVLRKGNQLKRYEIDHFIDKTL